MSLTAYQKRDNEQLQKVIVAQKAAEDKARKLEDTAAMEHAAALNAYRKGVNDEKVKSDSRVAAVVAGTLKLRDPGSKAGASTACDNGLAKGETPSTTTGSDGAKRTELSAEASGFLLKLTVEMDTIVRQLTAAQAIIVSDRVTCNTN